MDSIAPIQSREVHFVETTSNPADTNLSQSGLPRRIRLKCCYQGNIRVVNIHQDFQFSDLKARLEQDFGFEVMLQYYDDEGDMVLLACQNDMDEMTGLMTPSPSNNLQDRKSSISSGLSIPTLEYPGKQELSNPDGSMGAKRPVTIRVVVTKVVRASPPPAAVPDPQSSTLHGHQPQPGDPTSAQKFEYDACMDSGVHTEATLARTQQTNDFGSMQYRLPHFRRSWSNSLESVQKPGRLSRLGESDCEVLTLHTHGGLYLQRGELLGQGAFGKVFLTLSLDNGQLMAIKQIKMDSLSVKEFKSIEQEIHTLQTLRHTHIVQYLGTDTYNDGAKSYMCIMLEYVPGGSLATLVEKFGALGESVTRVYTMQLLIGLRYLHSNGIAHRDIKASNALVTNDGVIKLADFGASKHLIEMGTCTFESLLKDSEGSASYKKDLEDCHSPRTNREVSINTFGNNTIGTMGSLKGTPQYMAPEVIQRKQGEKGSSWFKADIWALACTVVEIATGRPPWFKFDNSFAAMYEVVHGTKTPTLPDTYSNAALQFCEDCFHRNPDKRPNASNLIKYEWFLGLQETRNRSLSPGHSSAQSSRQSRQLRSAGSRNSMSTLVHDHSKSNQDSGRSLNSSGLIKMPKRKKSSITTAVVNIIRKARSRRGSVDVTTTGSSNLRRLSSHSPYGSDLYSISDSRCANSNHSPTLKCEGVLSSGVDISSEKRIHTSNSNVSFEELPLGEELGAISDEAQSLVKPTPMGMAEVQELLQVVRDEATKRKTRTSLTTSSSVLESMPPLRYTNASDDVRRSVESILSLEATMSSIYEVDTNRSKATMGECQLAESKAESSSHVIVDDITSQNDDFNMENSQRKKGNGICGLFSRLCNSPTRRGNTRTRSSSNVRLLQKAPDKKVYLAGQHGPRETEIIFDNPIKRHSVDAELFNSSNSLPEKTFKERLWEGGEYLRAKKVQGFRSPLTCVSSLPSAPYILAGGQNGKIGIWNWKVQGQGLAMSFQCKEVPPTTTTVSVRFCFLMDHSFHIVTGYSDGSVRLWNPVSGTQQMFMERHIGSHDGDITCAVRLFPMSSSILAVGSIDSKITVWDTAQNARKVVVHTLSRGEKIKENLSHKFYPTALFWSEALQFIYSGYSDGRIITWCFKTGNILRKYVLQAMHSFRSTSKECTQTIEISAVYTQIDTEPKGLSQDIYIGCSTGHIFIIQKSDTKKTAVVKLQGHKRKVTGFAWTSTDPKYLTSCSIDKTIMVWDMEMKECILRKYERAPIMNIISIEGCLCFACLDGNLYFMNEEEELSKIKEKEQTNV